MTALALITLPWILALFHIVGPVPADLGVHDGQLSSCPAPAHCARETWSVQDPQGALHTLAAALSVNPRNAIVEQSDNYLHATCSSRLFGFVDDLELYADQDGTLEARSISRIGESDLGVNRERLQALRQVLGAP